MFLLSSFFFGSQFSDRAHSISKDNHLCISQIYEFNFHQDCKSAVSTEILPKKTILNIENFEHLVRKAYESNFNS